MLRHADKLKNEFNVKGIRIFGSYAEGRQNENSDLDLIVDFFETPTYFDIIELEEYLSNILDIKVDLLTEKGISPYILPYIEDTRVL
nr:nucleotidyltransferase family protein [Hippea maritima]